MRRSWSFYSSSPFVLPFPFPTPNEVIQGSQKRRDDVSFRMSLEEIFGKLFCPSVYVSDAGRDKRAVVRQSFALPEKHSLNS